MDLEARGAGLSRRESDVAALVAEGLTNREVGERLFIAQRTAEGHVEQILSKLGFHSRAQIAAWVVAGAALKTLAPDRSNLPPAPNAAIGRDGDVARLLALLRHTSGRVVTLSGPGGVGKTRLAIEVANQSREAFEDGVWFTDLTPLRDPELVPVSVARVLRVRQVPGMRLVDTISRHLSGRSLLLVLDNFEHLVTAAPLVTEMMNATSRSAVLITSREPLRLYGECEYPVSPLIPGGDGEGGEWPAVRLFVERARDVQPSMTFGPSDIAIVKEICERLDGLPLAIELAASRTRVLSSAAILARLTHSLTLLSAGARDVPSRHHALKACFAWSHDLLTVQEKLVFRRLAVFRGGFDVAAAESICSGDDMERDAVLDVVDSLVSKSLLRAEITAFGVRFHMLQTVFDFASELFAPASEAGLLIRQRHAHWYRDLAEREGHALRTAHQLAALERLDAEIHNVRAAVGHSRDIADQETWLRLRIALTEYWRLRGEDQQASELFRSRPVDGGNTTADLRGEALIAEIRMWGHLADPTAMAEIAARLAEVAPTCSDGKRLRAWSEVTISIVRTEQGELDQAREYEARARDMMRDSPDPFDAAWAAMLRGEIERSAGAPRPAASHYAEAIRVLDEAGIPRLLRMQLFANLGQAQLELGDEHAAAASMRASIAVARELNNTTAIAPAAAGLAVAGYRLAGCEETARLLGAAEACLARTGLAAWTGADKAPRDRLERNLISDLGEDTYRALYREGALRSIEEALNEYDSATSALERIESDGFSPTVVRDALSL